MTFRDRDAMKLRRNFAICVYVLSVASLAYGLYGASKSNQSYNVARYIEETARPPQSADARGPKGGATNVASHSQAERHRSSGDEYLSRFIVATSLALVGLIGAALLLRSTPSGAAVADLPTRIGFPRWPPWEPTLAVIVIIGLGLGPLSSQLPEPEGVYEVTGIEVNVAEEHFEKALGLPSGTQPCLFVTVRHNNRLLLDTKRDGHIISSHTASFSDPFRVNWRRGDHIVLEVRSDLLFGSRLLLLMDVSYKLRFPLHGATTFGGRSSVAFASGYVGECEESQ